MFSQSLRDALGTYGRQFGRVVAIQALLVIAFTIITVGVALLARQAVVSLMDYMAPGGEPAPERVLGVAFSVVVAGALVLLPFGVATIAATIGVADESLAGRRASIWRWLGRGLRRWLPITGSVIVAVFVPVALILASPALVVVGIVGLAVVGGVRIVRHRNARLRGDAPTSLPSTRPWVLMAIPFAFALRSIPIALLVVPAAVLEPAGPFEAWSIARQQASGRRVAAFGAVAIAFMAYAGITALAAWLLPLVLDPFTAQALSLLVALVTLPAVFVAMAAVYRNAAGPSGRALDPGERSARGAKRHAAEPAFTVRVAMLVVASLVVAGAGSAPTPAVAAGTPITPTITIDAVPTVAFGDTLGIDVSVSDLAGLTYPTMAIKYWVYQGTPEPDPAVDSVSGWPDGGFRSLTLPAGTGHIDVNSSYLAPGTYSLKVYFEPATQDAANYTTAVTDWNFTVLPRTRTSVDAPATALGGAAPITATVDNLDGADAPQGTMEFRWRPDADTGWSAWSAPVALVDAGGYSTASLPGGLTLGAVGAYRVEAHYVPSGAFAPGADGQTLLVVGSKPTFRQIISYNEPHAVAPTTFVVRVEAYGNGPDAVTSIPPSGDAFLYLYETATLSGPPSGPQLAFCPDAPLVPVAGETLVWEYSCTVSFDTPGKFGLASGGYNGDDLWSQVYPGGMIFDPAQRFTVGEIVKGTPTLSLSTTATTDWVGNETVPLHWSITGPTAGVALILSQDGAPIATLSGTSGTHNVTLPANLGTSSDTIATTFDLAYAGSTLWNSASTTLAGGVTACIPVGASTVSPGGSGTISLATTAACGSGATAGFTPGTVVHWTVAPNDTTTLTAVHLAGNTDASLVTVNGTDISTIADRSRTLALAAEFETTCASVTVPLSVTVAESSNCGASTGWSLIVSDGVTLKSNSYLAGTILQLSYTLPDAKSTFAGWVGPLASGVSTDATVGARVTNSGIGVTPTFSPMCFPVTLSQMGAVGRGYITTSPNCHLPGVASPGNADNGFAAGTTVNVGVIRPNVDDSYTASITVAPQGGPATRKTFAAYTGSLSVSTSFVVTAPMTVSWAAGRCVLVQAVGVNANHDRDLSMSNPYLYAHVASSGCGNHPAGAVGPTGFHNAAYAAIGDTVSISSVSPRGDDELLHFQGWKRGPSDPSGFTPPNQSAFQWTVTGPADFEAYWGQAVNCQAIEVVMVPANAFTDVHLSSEQANGCPAGTFDLADTLSAASGSATVSVSATPNLAVSQDAVYGIGYSSNSYDASSRVTAPVSVEATGGVSRAIAAYGATTITLYACQAINASAQLKSPADDNYYPADASHGDFFFVSVAENCVIDGESYWSVGSTVDVAAAPEGGGYRFAGWEGPGVVDGTIVTVSLTGDGPGVDLVADFDISCYTLTSNYAEGVNVSPAPNCPGYAQSEHKWVAWTVITLTVDEEVMKENMDLFFGWTGGPDSASFKTAGVILSSDRAVYADFRSGELEATLARTTSALGQTFVGVVAGALSGLLLGSNPVTAALGIVNIVLGGVTKIAGALGASGDVLDALTSAADATQWLTNLITAPMSCVSNWSGGEGGAGGSASPLERDAGRSIGKTISKEWKRMAQGGQQSATSTVKSGLGGGLIAFQVMNTWIGNLNNDPDETWGSFTDSFASCMTESVYPPDN